MPSRMIAIRLADRIAIMRDGIIVQVGTAEDLALNPAEPYVSEFMRDIPLSQVISVSTIMSKGAPAGGSDLPLLTTDRIIHVAPRVLATERAIDVNTPDGGHAGTLGKDALISFLASEFKALNEKAP